MSNTDSPYYWLNPAYKRVSSQKEIIIGIQGGVGSFNEEAIRRYFKENNCSNYTIKYLYTTKNVLEALRKNEIDVGQFAFSNSIAGVVEESVKAMKDLEFEVIDYYTIKIQHALMTRNDIEFCEVKRILTHPVVLLQCKENLKKNIQGLSSNPVMDY